MTQAQAPPLRWLAGAASLGRPGAHLVAGATAVAAVALPVLLDALPDRSALSVPWGAALFAAGWAVWSRAPADVAPWCRGLFGVAFAARAVVAALLVGFDFWQDDELRYHDLGHQFVVFRDYEMSPAELWALGPLRYSALCGWLYRILGFDTFGPRLLNVWMGAMVPPLVYLTARRYGTERVARGAGWLTALFPDLLLYSAFQLKEAGVTLAVTGFIWALTERLHGGARRFTWAMMLGAVGVAASFRLFVVLPLAFGLVWQLSERWRLMNRRAMTAFALLLGADLALFFLAPAFSVTSQALNALPHASLYDTVVDRESFFNVFAGGYTPRAVATGFVYTLMVPFIVWPFTVDGTIYLLLGPGTVLWYALMPFALRGALHLHAKAASTTLVVLVCITLALTVGGGFNGTGRHRTMMMPILLFWATRGLADLRAGDVWARRLAVAYFGALVAGLGYYAHVKGL
jgi:hypothetical protein